MQVLSLYLLLPGLLLRVGIGLEVRLRLLVLLPLRFSATYPHFEQVLDVARRHLGRVTYLLLLLVVPARRGVRHLLRGLGLGLVVRVLLLAPRVRSIPTEETI